MAKKRMHGIHHSTHGGHHHDPMDHQDHEDEDVPDFHDDSHFFVVPLRPGDPGPKARKKILPPNIGILIPKTGSKIQLKRVQNPNPNGSFGFINRFVRVPDSNPKGTLVISLDLKKLGSVALETLRIFRWIQEKKMYRLVQRSGIGQTREYVWAKVTEPGLYAVIGVNGDPLIARTLAILHYFHGWLHTGNPSANKKLHKRLCELILSNSEMQKALLDPKVARPLVEENLRHGLPGKWPGGIPPHKSKKAWQKIEKICNSPDFPHEPPESALISFNVISPAEGGVWEVLPENTEILAIHAALLNTGKVLYFGGSEHDKKQHKKKKVNHTRLWDPVTGVIQTVGSPLHDLFCCGHAFLSDGKLVAAGGTQKYGPGYRGLRETSIFDPAFIQGQNPWTAASFMHTERGKTTGGGRWYPTLVTLQDGKLLTVSGFPDKTDTRTKNIMIEIFDPNPASLGAYSDQGDQPNMAKNYPRVHLLPDGQVFCATDVEGKNMKLDPITNVKTDIPGPGNEFENFATSTVLLPLLPNAYTPRVLLVGAAQPKIIDLSISNPVWQNTNPRTLPGLPPRKNLNVVLLPDATVLVVGGSETKKDADAVLAAEVYDPSNGQWSTFANSAVPRLYHSVALLLPDGRVWTAGSNYDCDPGLKNRELRMEVFSPPYLFQGPRPVITSAPASVAAQPATTFTINSSQANDIATVCILRCGSVTHSFDADQRYVGLTIQSHTAATLTVAAPPNKKIAPPGFYLLFIVDNDGVPSIGRFIRIT